MKAPARKIFALLALLTLGLAFAPSADAARARKSPPMIFETPGSTYGG